jgi:hypothetical protein
MASARNGSESVYRKERPIVRECLLSRFVQTIKSSYDSGTYHETVQAAFENTTAGPSPWIRFRISEEDGGGAWTEYKENITIVPHASRLDSAPLDVTDAVYGVTNITANMAMATFDDFFPSYYTKRGDLEMPQLSYEEYDDGPHIRFLPFNPWLAPSNIITHVNRLATAITNSIRSSQSREMLSGQAYQRETYVRIKWEWLSFPFVLLTLSLVSLVATFIKTSGDNRVRV